MTGPRGTPLDLRAVRERTEMLKAVADGNPVVAATVADLEGLDAALRATRAALDDALTGLHNLLLCFNVGDHQDVRLYKHPFCNSHDFCLLHDAIKREERAAAVLAQGRDE